MEEYISPVMEVIEFEEEVILTSSRCGAGNPKEQEASMADIY